MYIKQVHLIIVMDQTQKLSFTSIYFVTVDRVPRLYRSKHEGPSLSLFSSMRLCPEEPSLFALGLPIP